MHGVGAGGCPEASQKRYARASTASELHDAEKCFAALFGQHLAVITEIKRSICYRSQCAIPQLLCNYSLSATRGQHRHHNRLMGDEEALLSGFRRPPDRQPSVIKNVSDIKPKRFAQAKRSVSF